MSPTRYRFLEYYTVAIRGFVDAVGEVNAANIPEPHLPLWGSGYDQANPKILFIGEETRGWRKNGMSGFLEIARENPDNALNYHLDEMKKEIDSLQFMEWTKSDRDFFGTIYRLLAQFHGIVDWKLLKRKDPAIEHLLLSFAWANTQAVEWHKTIKLRNLKHGIGAIDQESWQKLFDASWKHFNSLPVQLDVFQPHVAIIMNWIGFPKGYWGRELHWNWLAPNIKHLAYTLYEGQGYKTHIFKTAHPTYLSRRKLHDKVLKAIEFQWNSLRAPVPPCETITPTP